MITATIGLISNGPVLGKMFLMGFNIGSVISNKNLAIGLFEPLGIQDRIALPIKARNRNVMAKFIIESSVATCLSFA